MVASCPAEKTQKRFVVIESDFNLHIKHEPSVHSDLVYRDATLRDDIFLLKAGVLKAKALITTLPADAANVFIVLTARNLWQSSLLFRAPRRWQRCQIKIAGADNVIMPDKVGGAHMASWWWNPRHGISGLYYHSKWRLNNKSWRNCSDDPQLARNKTLKDLKSAIKGSQYCRI